MNFNDHRLPTDEAEREASRFPKRPEMNFNPFRGTELEQLDPLLMFILDTIPPPTSEDDDD